MRMIVITITIQACNENRAILHLQLKQIRLAFRLLGEIRRFPTITMIIQDDFTKSDHS